MRWSFLWIVGCGPQPVDLSRQLPPEESVAAPCAAEPCVAPVGSDGRLGFHRVVVDEAGVAWVSWVETEDLRPTGFWVAASPAPGAPLEAPTAVPIEEAPILGGPEKPSLDVFDGRIALAHTGIGTRRHGDAVAVYVIEGVVDGTQATFDAPTLIDITNVEGWVAEHAMVSLGPDTDWLLYKRQVYGSRDIPTFARSSTDFEPEMVSDGLSRSHECSPPQLARGADGSMMLALRSNIEGTLHTVVLTQEGDGFGLPVQVSQTGWPYSPLVCPPDGPRITQHPDGTLLTTWVAPFEDTLRTFLGWSTDDGLTWTVGVDHDAVGFSETWPTVTARPDGSVITTVAVPGGDTWRFTRSSIGDAPESEVVQTPDGQPLAQVEVATGGGRTVALGRGPQGLLWLVELP